MVRTARLIRNGQSQAVRLPKEFKFSGGKVFIKKVGDEAMLIPYRQSWQSLIDSLEQFSDDFKTERGQPDQQAREGVFG